MLVFFSVCFSGAARADNPYGVMLWSMGGANDLKINLARARGLGVAWYRPPTIFTDNWDGSCSTCNIYRNSGLSLALTVRNGSSRGASYPPIDLDSYRQKLVSILRTWHPAIVAIESKEDRKAFYLDSDLNFNGYKEELKAACAVAHSEGISCMNGGLSFDNAVLATWYNILQTKSAKDACDFAGRALPDNEIDLSSRKLCAISSAAEAWTVLEEQLRSVAILLNVYRESPIDAINFHWYGRSARALSEVAIFLSQRTGKTVATNEIGQRPGSAFQVDVKPLMKAAYASRMKVVIWYSIESSVSVSLFEPDGRLRPTGWEFQHQLLGRSR